MNVSVAELSATERELSIELPASEIDSVFNTKVDQYRKNISMPGFRPGKLPKDLVKKRFGASIREEVLDQVINNAIRTACTEHKIRPVGPGRIDALEAPEGGNLTFKAVLEVDAEIELKDYSDLGVTVSAAVVGEDDVADQLKNICERMAEVRKAERPSQSGDLVTARYLKIAIEGEERAIGETPVFQAELGKGIAEVDQGLTGRNPEEEVEISFTFPADYADAELAGKKGLYVVKIEAVLERIVPELTDEFAQKIGPFKNVEELRARVQDDVAAHLEEQMRNKAYDEAVDVLLTRNPFPVPEARMKAYLNWQLERMAQYNRGAELPSVDALFEQFRGEAEKAVRRQRALEWIAEKEKIQVETVDVDARLKEMAAQYGVDAEMIREDLRQRGQLSDIREDLRIRKTLDWLVGIR